RRGERSLEARADSGELDRARADAFDAVRREQEGSNPFFHGLVRRALAYVLRRSGERASAAGEARAAGQLLAANPLDRAIALATLAGVLVDDGRSEDALGPAEEARREVGDTPGYADTMIQLTYAEALGALATRPRAASSPRRTRGFWRARGP